MSDLAKLITASGMRLTKPRLALARLLFGDGKNRHVCVEQLVEHLDASGTKMAQATVYNSLNRFVRAGLLRQIAGTGNGVTIFDTNTEPHHHFLNETTGKLTDIPLDDLPLTHLPTPPEGEHITACDIVIRTR